MEPRAPQQRIIIFLLPLTKIIPFSGTDFYARPFYMQDRIFVIQVVMHRGRLTLEITNPRHGKSLMLRGKMALRLSNIVTALYKVKNEDGQGI